MKVETPKLEFELFRRILHLPNRMPKKIQIEITNCCNLSCKLCPRTNFNLPNIDINTENFKHILSKLKEVEVILPVGWGEPFLNKNLNIIIDLIVKNGNLIKLPTNGALLTSPETIITALKTDYLTFSIDDMHLTKRANILSIIEKIINAKNIKTSQKPYITIQLVLYKNEIEIYDTIREAKLIGVERVNIIRPAFDDSNNFNWEERKRIYKNAELLSKQLGIRVDMFEYAIFFGIKRFLWKHFKGIFRINSWCPRLSDFLYVTLDGTVTPCCYLPRHIVGDLMTQNIHEIWNGKSIKNFRHEHKQICQNCQILRIK